MFYNIYNIYIYMKHSRNKRSKKYKIKSNKLKYKSRTTYKKYNSVNKKTKKMKGGEKRITYRTKEPIAQLSIDVVNTPKLSVYLISHKRNVRRSEEYVDNPDYEYVVKIPDNWKHHLQKHPIKKYDRELKQVFDSGYIPLSYIEDISEFIDDKYISEDILKLWKEEATILHNHLYNNIEVDIDKLNKETEALFKNVDNFTRKTAKKRVKRNLDKITELPIRIMKDRFYAPPGVYSENGGPGYMRSKKNFETLQNSSNNY